MFLSKNEIIEHASRYMDDPQIVDFPMEGDAFAILGEPVNKPKDWPKNGRIFGGYGICRGYVLDEDSKPLGKWLFMMYDDLSKYPPVLNHAMKLQPPHVVTGHFYKQDRTMLIKIVKVDFKVASKIEPEVDKSDTTFIPKNILQFPSKGKS